MSAVATIAGVVKVLQKGWMALCKAVNIKRRQIARAELEALDGQGKDLDGDGVIGGVGNNRRSRDRLRRGNP